jgi:hypothetical protein
LVRWRREVDDLAVRLLSRAVVQAGIGHTGSWIRTRLNPGHRLCVAAIFPCPVGHAFTE